MTIKQSNITTKKRKDQTSGTSKKPNVKESREYKNSNSKFYKGSNETYNLA